MRAVHKYSLNWFDNVLLHSHQSREAAERFLSDAVAGWVEIVGAP